MRWTYGVTRADLAAFDRRRRGFELGIEEAAAGEEGELGEREKDGVLGGVQTRREARLLLSKSPQSLYSAKVKWRRRAGGEASSTEEAREREGGAGQEKAMAVEKKCDD